MAMKSSIKSLNLPEGLEQQFLQLRLRLLKVFSFQAVMACLGALVVAFLALWISDRFWDTPFSWRMAMWVLFFFVVYVQSFIFMRYGLECGSSPMRMARHVQKSFRRLGDRLSGILELSDPSKRPSYYSARLYEAAIGQVASEASQFDFNQSVPVAAKWRLAKFVLLISGIAFFLIVLFPEATIPTLKRLIIPWGGTSRFTMVHIESVPDSIRVPHGEPFQIQGVLRYSTFWKPATVHFEIPGAIRQQAQANHGLFALDLPGCIEPMDVQFSAGDADHVISVIPVVRPALESVQVTIHHPEYLHYDDQTISGLSGRIEVVEGSSLTLEAQVTRPLSSAEWSLDTRLWQPLSFKSSTWILPSIEAASGNRLSVRWTDEFGFSGASPWGVAIDTFKDSAPTLQLKDLVPMGAYLETEVIPAVVQATDDFGIAMSGLEWTLILDEQSDELTEVPGGKFQRETGAFNSLVSTENFGFSPRLLGVPPDSIIEVRGFARDFRPVAETVYTEPISIMVVSVDRHAELLRQNLESILSQSEDILRAEENISEFNRMALEELDLEAPMEAVRDRIEANAEMQQQNAKDLQRLAAMGQQLLREAMRNPNFESTAIREWNDTLQQMQSLSEQQMPQAAEQMKSAASASQPSSSDASQELKQAQEMIEDILQDLASLQDNINEGLDQLQAMTLAQRLRALGRKQSEIIDMLKRSVARTIGLTIDELSSKFIKANEAASEEQSSLSDQAEELIQEISRFAERTELEPYELVSKEMKDQAPVEDLGDISEKINRNILARSMSRQAVWSDQFEAWAKALEPPAQDGDGGQGGEGSESGEQDQDNAMLEMMIKLLRIREKEIDIQKQTRLLNGTQVEQKELSDSASRLSGEQLGLLGELDLMSQSNPLVSLAPVLKEGMDNMLNVSTLLSEPRVDTTTDMAEADTVNTLTDAINIINEISNNQSQQQSQQQQSQQQTTAQQMAFLMQMMSQTPTPSPMPGTQGNPNAGGDSANNPDSIQGDVTGKSNDSRKVERAAGSLSEMPAEYRPMLEKYFQLLEDIQK